MSSLQDEFEPDEALDASLRDFFANSLDGQVGRSEREFQSHLRLQIKSGRRQRTLLLLAFTTGMAATIAGLWASPLFHVIDPVKPQISLAPTTASPAQPAAVVECVTNSRTIDEGIVMLDNTPMRVYRKQTVDQVNLFEGDDQVLSSEGAPNDTLVFVKMNTY